MNTTKGGSAKQALGIATRYFEAMSKRDGPVMAALRGPNFEFDLVYRDASGTGAPSVSGADSYYRALFEAFSGLDFECTRIVAADTVAVVEWTFVGNNTGPVAPLLPGEVDLPVPSGRTVTLRGVTVLDIVSGAISRETIYTDQATLLVELGSGAGTGQ